jgi:hypothetical protein
VRDEWGRKKDAGQWPKSAHAWAITTGLLAIAAFVSISSYRYRYTLTPLQRFYIETYFRSGFRTAIGFKTGRYTLLNVADKKGTRLALDEEVVPVTTTKGEATFALSDTAVMAGDKRLVFLQAEYNNGKLHDFLGHWIYRDQTVMFFGPAAWGSLGVLCIGFVAAIPRDRIRAKERRVGRRLRGPELVTPKRFNRESGNGGISFELTERNFIQRLLGQTPTIKLPADIERNHILIMGDTGTGKSTLVRRILLQIQERGETAIVYDPALEYVPEFYRPERGDMILNPLDERMPYWSPGEELQDPAEALSLATSLFPDRRNENQFFIEAPRKIFAHLLTFRPTPDELALWMCREEEIDRRVKGTPYAAMIDRQAPAQRSGVLASLNMVADALKLLPSQKEVSRRWSAREWSKNRNGWVFLTSTPETRERLLPLTSLWLDTLVLRLMKKNDDPNVSKVWFLLDELATLQRLPQLHTAVTENRKSGNPVVLGFQGRSQLEARYGHEAEAMLSQPATKIFHRTSEPNAAEWISRTIGGIETERLKESRSSGQFGSHRKSTSEDNTRQIEPLVMDSEISGLPDLRGYLKCGNYVVRMSFPVISLPQRHAGYIQRPMNTEPEEMPLKAAATVGDRGSLGRGLEPQEITHSQERNLQRAGQRHFFQ